MTDRWERALSLLLTLAAIVIAGVMVHREFAKPQPRLGADNAPPEFVPHWQDLLRGAATVGPASSPVTVIEFMDLECPYCKAFHDTLGVVRLKYPNAIRVAVLDLPITGHRFAIPAARALECANRLGRFEAFFDAVYANQDSLGLKSWSSFARDVNIRDTVAFDTCVTSPREVPQIESGVSLAHRLNVHATPTVLVNGWRFHAPPTREQLDSAVRNAIRVR